MKLSLVILAFYVAVLSCFPCQDVPARMAGNISTGLTQGDSHHDDHTADFCSPFCICSCCASVSLPPLNFGLAVNSSLPLIPEKSFEYKASFNTASIGSIWQPPRLA